MDYLPQIIIFILALIGIFFKSTETDDEGKTLHSPHGLPYLTIAGKIIVCLLTASFLVSLSISLSNSEKEKIKDMEAANREATLQKKLDDISKKTLSPITGVSVSFEISITLEDNNLTNYKNRLLREMGDFSKRNPEKRRVAFGSRDDSFPQPLINGEFRAFEIFRFVDLEVKIFKAEFQPEDFAKIKRNFEGTTGDFSFPVKFDIPETNEDAGKMGGIIFYFYSSHSGYLTISAFNKAIESSTWERKTGKIASVGDLSKAQVFVIYGDHSKQYESELNLRDVKLNILGYGDIKCNDIKDIKREDSNSKLYFCTLDKISNEEKAQ